MDDEDIEGKRAWGRFLRTPVKWKYPQDRALVGRALLNEYWRRGDLAAVVELAESLAEELGEEPETNGGETDGRKPGTDGRGRR